MAQISCGANECIFGANRYRPSAMGEGLLYDTGTETANSFSHIWTSENNWLVPAPNLITRANAKYRTMLKQYRSGGVRVMVFNATFNNSSVISWRNGSPLQFGSFNFRKLYILRLILIYETVKISLKLNSGRMSNMAGVL